METKMKVLIAYDGVNPIEKKINDLKRAGLPKDAEATVFTAVDAFMPPTVAYGELGLSVSSINYMEAEREAACARIKKNQEKAKKKATHEAKCLQRAFPQWTVHSEAVVDSPNWAIIKKEDEWKPDLIVMGSHGGSVAARFFLGSVSRSVLIHSKCSVHIVRKHRKAKKSPIHLVIGADGSLDCQAAVNVVAGRCWPPKTSVKLVTAFDEKMVSAIAFHHFPSPEKCEDWKIGEKECVRRITAPFKKKFQDAGLEVSDVIKAGTPWKVLVQEAEAWKADCIFVGARGLGMMDRFLLGSVSNSVVSRAHCSVEVVRPKK